MSRGRPMSSIRGFFRAFKRFWHDQITTPNGDIDGARVGLLLVLFGVGSLIYLEYYAVIHAHQAYDPGAFGDGLIKAGSAIGLVCAGVAVKSGTEIPYNPLIAAANFPEDAGAQAAAGVNAQIGQITAMGNQDVAEVKGVWNNIVAFYHHVMSFFHKPPQPPSK